MWTPLFLLIRPWFSPYPNPGLDTIESKACEVHELYGLTTSWRVIKNTLVESQEIDRSVNRTEIQERVSENGDTLTITRL